MWAKNMALADQRWRQNWERRLAERRKAMAKVDRIAARIKRQRSWEVWQAAKLLTAERKLQQQEPRQRRQLGAGQQAQPMGNDGRPTQVQAGDEAAPAAG